jgi:serine/threonine-protein kinase
MTPRQVGNYRLDQLLGVGGMGEVYQAYDTQRDRFIALKLLPEVFSDDPEYLKRFQRESHVAARLREPHVIPIHDFGEIDGRLFIDMRLVDGGDIRTMLDEHGPMAPQRVVNLLGQVAQALDAAHADDLVHRDIKPSNILVTPRDFVYVVDFGIARPMRGRQTSLTITGATIGTLDYMAPERFAGRAVDGRADIYSLACVLHECLTGKPPFEGEDLPSLMYAHLNGSPPQASTMVEGVSRTMDTVIARGMAKDPGDRFPTATELVDAAGDALLVEEPAPAWRRAVPPPAARPQATVVDIPETVTSPAPEPEPAEVAEPAVVAEPAEVAEAAAVAEPAGASEPAGDRLSAGVPSGPAESVFLEGAGGSGSAPPGEQPDQPGRRRRGVLVGGGIAAAVAVVALVLVFAWPGSGSPQKTRSSGPSVPASLADPTVAKTITAGKSANSVQIAPNGKFAYVADADDDMITVLSTANDSVTEKIKIPQGSPQFVSFSPDSRTAYVSIYNGASYDDDSATVHLIAFVDTATSKVTGTVQVNNEKPGPTTTSPDGRYLYVPDHDMTMGFSNGDKVDVIDTSTKQLTDSIVVPMNPHGLVFGDGGKYFYTSDHMSGEVTVLSAQTNRIVKEIPVGETPHGEAISPDGKILAVTSWSGNEIFVVNTATDKVTARIPVGKNPQADVYATDGRHLYVVDAGSNTVSVIDTSDNRVTATVPTGKAPTSISVLPNGRQAYVSDQGDGTVEVLNIGK